MYLLVHTKPSKTIKTKNTNYLIQLRGALLVWSDWRPPLCPRRSNAIFAIEWTRKVSWLENILIPGCNNRPFLKTISYLSEIQMRLSEYIVGTLCTRSQMRRGAVYSSSRSSSVCLHQQASARLSETVRRPKHTNIYLSRHSLLVSRALPSRQRVHYSWDNRLIVCSANVERFIRSSTEKWV